MNPPNCQRQSARRNPERRRYDSPNRFRHGSPNGFEVDGSTDRYVHRFGQQQIRAKTWRSTLGSTCPPTTYVYEVREGATVVATGRFSRDEPLAGDTMVISGTVRRSAGRSGARPGRAARDSRGGLSTRFASLLGGTAADRLRLLDFCQRVRRAERGGAGIAKNEATAGWFISRAGRRRLVSLSQDHGFLRFCSRQGCACDVDKIQEVEGSRIIAAVSRLATTWCTRR
jgi:hypothetical protein